MMAISITSLTAFIYLGEQKLLRGVRGSGILELGIDTIYLQQHTRGVKEWDGINTTWTDLPGLGP